VGFSEPVEQPLDQCARQQLAAKPLRPAEMEPYCWGIRRLTQAIVRLKLVRGVALCDLRGPQHSPAFPRAFGSVAGRGEMVPVSLDADRCPTFIDRLAVE
jgi:hypothetical protein